MKMHVILAALLLFTAGGASAAEHTWKGTISDNMCGASHKEMAGKLSDRDCTLSCAKSGAPYVLVSDGKTYQLTGHDADLRTHAGHAVNLTGELKGETIRVSKIDMPATK
jgi:hypothetical protein